MKWPLALPLTIGEKYRPTTTIEAGIQKREHVVNSIINLDNIKTINATINSPQTNATAFLLTAPTTTVQVICAGSRPTTAIIFK
jgi:hypothetical protein